MKNRSVLRIFILILILFVVFSIVPSAFAKLKATSSFYIWDDSHLHFSHSLANLNLDGEETNIIHELGFDKDFYDPTAPSTKEMCDKVAALNPDGIPNSGDEDPSWREDCPPARNSTYAGVMELGVPYEKIEDTGIAKVFDHTLEWSLVDCDLNNDLSWDNQDLNVNTVDDRPENLANWDIMNMPAPTVPLPLGDQRDYFKVLAIDVITDCSMGNCSKELVTTIFLDLDINQDGKITKAEDGAPADESSILPSGCICFYAKAFSISWPTNPPTPLWGGNPQARITAGGGDKTVNFNLLGPSVISLTKFDVYSPGGIHPFAWLTIFSLLSGIAFILIRESRYLLR